MQTVTIPDPLYAEALSAAQASGVSLDRFVSEALQLHLGHTELSAVRLSPEQVAIIRQSQADIRAGKGIPIAQVKAELIAERAEWLQANPS
jgi:hypothetical protein